MTMPALDETPRPLPLTQRMRTLTILRQTLDAVQGRTPTDDPVLFKMVADCIEIVDDGMRDALQEQRADISAALSQSIRLAGVERQIRTLRTHLGLDGRAESTTSSSTTTTTPTKQGA